jgi:hypothetical protein
MSDIGIIRRILEEQFPEACDQVGPSTVSEILRGDLDVTKPPTGRFIDIWHLLQILTTAITVARVLIDAYPVVTARLKHKPTRKDMKDELERSGTPKGALKDKEVDGVIDAVLREKQSP